MNLWVKNKDGTKKVLTTNVDSIFDLDNCSKAAKYILDIHR